MCDVITLSDATSYDKDTYTMFDGKERFYSLRVPTFSLMIVKKTIHKSACCNYK